jgi:uncharacterized protein
MRPRIKVLTLAVRDLEESLAFYRDGMGLPTQGIISTEFEDGAVVFFNMNDDLHGYWHCTRGPRWPRTQGSQLDHRAQQIRYRPHRQIQTRSRCLMKQAEKAGARITDPPHDRFWGGYSGYFQDLDGHLWEIAWNPEWEVKE